MSALADQVTALGAEVVADHGREGRVVVLLSSGVMGTLREAGYTARMAHLHPHGNVVTVEIREPAKRGVKVIDRDGRIWTRGNRLWHAYGTDEGRVPWSSLLAHYSPLTIPEEG